MALTADFANKVIDSTASIPDVVAFHQALRVLEASDTGMLYPIIHTFKAIDLGAGGYFYSVDFVNGWRLRFPSPGDYTITGNINTPVIGVAGVFVDRTKALAFATSAAGGGGSSGLTTEQADMLTALAKIHGLVRGTPLVVGPTSRAAGDLVQTVTELGGVVTVERP